ncbi:MAG: hypothetical protein IPM32_09305 [Ignavibacteriae bacterium]|nr:hypothetical protein [Ignavibacteriota bacterium]
MLIQHKENLFKKSTNDKSLIKIYCFVKKQKKELCTFDPIRKTIFISKNHRKYSKTFESFGIPHILLTDQSLDYDKILIQTKRRIYSISRSFWRWNGNVEDCINPLNYLHIDNFQSFKSIGGKNEK